MCLVKNTEREEKYNTISILKSLKHRWKTTLKYSVHFFLFTKHLKMPVLKTGIKISSLEHFPKTV